MIQLRSRTFVLALVASALMMLVHAAPASAQSAGVRVGASVDPDQFFFGGHLETPPLADRIHFRPNIEIGVGNDVTLTAINFELVYKFPERSDWQFYGGGGPALNLYSSEGDTNAQSGFNILLGVEHRQGLFFEIKAGMADSPNFKVGVGYVFKKR
jgi:hypothetical protein